MHYVVVDRDNEPTFIFNSLGWLLSDQKIVNRPIKQSDQKCLVKQPIEQSDQNCNHLLKMSEMIVEECSTVWLTEINFSLWKQNATRSGLELPIFINYH